MWAETSVPQLLHADEAAKHLCYALHRDRRREMSRFSLTLTTAVEITTGLNQHHSDTQCKQKVNIIQFTKVSRFIAKLFY